MNKTIVHIDTREPRRISEALRAAVGLTLRNASVTVVLPDDTELRNDDKRALATLTTLGCQRNSALPIPFEADAMEVWT